ncbi:methyltransferase domain-containing protein [uncultured Sulfitobacter sp.]|uniref:class I SAM-dependent DNA methyltransferase n=1 Tax=uncultured Sulfitobacter sp. TaxID=191468 RepID=UPI002634795C|nr:methyltransferase domain-containing protein [uncultured Sulfitobacter sp.]
MSDGYLNKVYAARNASETRALYDAWSASYETELAKNGYVTPSRCAAALADVQTDRSLPILDFGCGTGLGGLALKLAGFEVIDGVDLSAEMIAQAAGKNVYRTLTQIEPDAPLGFTPGTYATIAAIGVIGAGAAPLALFDTLMHGLAPGGIFLFSFNDHTLEDPAFEARISEWTDCGAASLLFREHGDHVPGIGLKAAVYVLEKR